MGMSLLRYFKASSDIVKLPDPHNLLSTKVTSSITPPDPITCTIALHEQQHTILHSIRDNHSPYIALSISDSQAI